MILTIIFSLLTLTKTEAPKDFDDVLPKKKGGLAVGIDLGTTYSCLRAFDPNTNSLLNLKIDNNDTYPSVLCFDTYHKDNEAKHLALTGYDAISYNAKNPDSNNFFYAFKRLLALTAKDMKNENLKDLDKKVSYKVSVENDTVSMLHLDANNNVVQKVRPIDASSEILKYIIKTAYSYSDVIDSVIVTVPAYFTENQVKATSLAAELAGIKLTRTLNEPVAAAYAFQIKNPESNAETFLVLDFGGGTLDISVLEKEDGVLEVRTYSGDNFCGGENVNHLLFNEFLRQLKQSDVALKNENDKQRLRAFTEVFKKNLCNRQNKIDKLDKETYSDIELSDEEVKSGTAYCEDFFYISEDEEPIKLHLNTNQFNTVCKPVFDKVRKYLEDKSEGIISKYKKLGGNKDSISRVLFVGGSSRIPYIRKMCGQIFGMKKLNFDLNADTCVAEGAAWYSANMSGYLDEKTSLYLVDVVPMNIGICVNEDQFESILEMNATIPATGSKIFTTAYDMQERVSIQVGQGLRYSFKLNQNLGKFDLNIKNPGPRGVPQIEVTVTMDKDRNVHVRALDKATNLEEKITFTRNDTSLSSEEIEKMKQDKEMHKAEDEEMRSRHEARVSLENTCAMFRKQSEGMPDEVKGQVERLVGKAEAFIKMEGQKADKAEFENKENELREEVGRLVKEGMGQEVPDQRGPEEKVREEL